MSRGRGSHTRHSLVTHPRLAWRGRSSLKGCAGQGSPWPVAALPSPMWCGSQSTAGRRVERLSPHALQGPTASQESIRAHQATAHTTHAQMRLVGSRKFLQHPSLLWHTVSVRQTAAGCVRRLLGVSNGCWVCQTAAGCVKRLRVCQTAAGCIKNLHICKIIQFEGNLEESKICVKLFIKLIKWCLF